VATFGNFGSGGIVFQFEPRPCPRCSQPGAVVMKGPEVAKLLEDVRKLVHPDVCSSPRATAVTARLNAILDELRRQQASH
jgi:hypothetical protein